MFRVAVQRQDQGGIGTTRELVQAGIPFPRNRVLVGFFRQ